MQAESNPERNAGSLANTCSEELVAFPHKIAGCALVVKRKKFEGHLSDKDHHLQVLMGVFNATYGIIQGGFRPDVSSIPLAFCPWLQNTPTCYPRPLWFVKLEGFQEKKENEEEWFSDPVHSHFGGYKMCLRVDANGGGDGRGAYLSAFVTLTRGDNDDNLAWPFKGTIKVSLLDQLVDGQHFTVEFWSPTNLPEDSRRHVAVGDRASSGLESAWGYCRFVSHQNLNFCGPKEVRNLNDDAIYFRVELTAVFTHYRACLRSSSQHHATHIVVDM